MEIICPCLRTYGTALRSLAMEMLYSLTVLAVKAHLLEQVCRRRSAQGGLRFAEVLRVKI